MIEKLDFSHERDLNLENIIRRVKAYDESIDLDIVRKAYHFAEEAHKGQKRRSGEDYIIHPLNVAATLIKLRMDTDSIVAGLLHDVVEDCDVTSEKIAEEFGEDISNIVVGLTKISKIKVRTTEENQAENFRKMIVAMARDIRVIIVKLADRMHNMRTLQYVSNEKQKRIAQETIDIYVPLASRLGINSVKVDLEDLCLRFLRPDIYYRLAEKVAMKKSERDHYIQDVVNVIHEKLKEYNVQAEIKGRSKHFYSIYKKMQQRKVDFDQIQDLLAFRMIVGNITECYKSLGIIHAAFTPIPGRFKDYIAIPKVNNYQSLHTTVIGPRAERIEIQIRTHDMHEVAETGVAAHWKYKQGVGSKNSLSWVNDLLEFNKSVQNNMEFLDVVKNDLNIGGVFVFTPNGDVKELRHGSTPIDFAFSIHTEVGTKCTGAKVNGKIVPLKYRLKSGDVVEILVSKSQTPSKDWLNIAKTSRARTKIKQELQKHEREKNCVLGKDIIDKACKMYDGASKALKKEGQLEKIVQELKAKSVDELYVNVGIGKISAKDVLKHIPGIEIEDEEKEEELQTYYNKLSTTVKKSVNKDNAVIVAGLSDIMVRMGKCCSPIPGDTIVGFITRGRGVTVHTFKCQKVSEIENERRVEVEWNSEFSFKHPVTIRVITHDRPGILALISKNINNQGINIRSALAKSLPDQKGSFIFEIEVKDYKELLKIISSTEKMDEVIGVERV